MMVSGKTTSLKPVLIKFTVRSVFDVRNLNALPKVVIIYGYQDDPEYMYDAAIAHHVTVLFMQAPARVGLCTQCCGNQKAEKSRYRGLFAPHVQGSCCSG